MKAVAYIIRGYKDEAYGRKGYDIIARYFKKRGVKPILAKIDWDRNVAIFDDFTKQFLHQYRKPKNEKVYVLGFSFGAVVALLSARRIKPDALILCSLSPYFKEDLKTLRPSYLKWWRKNMKDSDVIFSKIGRRVKSRTIILAGDKEGPEVMRRAKAAKRLIKKSSLVLTKGGRHKISQRQYLKTLGQVIADL